MFNFNPIPVTVVYFHWLLQHLCVMVKTLLQLLISYQSFVSTSTIAWETGKCCLSHSVMVTKWHEFMMTQKVSVFTVTVDFQNTVQ